MKSLWKSLLWLDFPWCNIFEKQSERKCSIFDPLWPDSSILEGESEKFVFLENKSIYEEKKYTAFLFLLGSTYVQKLRQFEFLTLAIKISFLFNFCTDVLLSKDDEGLTAAFKTLYGINSVDHTKLFVFSFNLFTYRFILS